jgi:hypothetical protein
VASLGNNMYERAYDYLKNNNSQGATAEENREGLIHILGEDCIGFWAILDQILFYETMVDELSTIGGTMNSASNSNEEVSFEEDEDTGMRKNAEQLGVMENEPANKKSDKNQIDALNEDSDLDMEEGYKDVNFENEGIMVGGSGSEKGDAI